MKHYSKKPYFEAPPDAYKPSVRQITLIGGPADGLVVAAYPRPYTAEVTDVEGRPHAYLAWDQNGDHAPANSLMHRTDASIGNLKSTSRIAGVHILIDLRDPWWDHAHGGPVDVTGNTWWEGDRR